MASKPAGITRPAMKQAMKMFQPIPTRLDGTIIESKPTPPPDQLEGQRDIFDVLIEAEIQIAGET